MAAILKTFTGRFVDPFHMRPGDVSIKDIAHALSCLCRFNGHCRHFYSVAQHSVAVSIMCEKTEPGTGIYGLLHDASEAYLCDVPRPIKHAPEFQFYRDLEKKVQATILASFGLSPLVPDVVKRMDDAICVLEGIDLMDELYTSLLAKESNLAGAQFKMAFMTPLEAEELFMERFRLFLCAQTSLIIPDEDTLGVMH